MPEIVPDFIRRSATPAVAASGQTGSQRRGRAAVYRYRVVDLQASAEMEATRTRCKQARTKIERAINEMEVRQAGPVAGAAVELIRCGSGVVGPRHGPLRTSNLRGGGHHMTFYKNDQPFVVQSYLAYEPGQCLLSVRRSC